MKEVCSQNAKKRFYVSYLAAHQLISEYLLKKGGKNRFHRALS